MVAIDERRRGRGGPARAHGHHQQGEKADAPGSAPAGSREAHVIAGTGKRALPARSGRFTSATWN
eukprot:3296681-Alexandrium_andersonii.AAC.1